MRYTSTRDRGVSLTSAEAILQGLSSDGGLLVPTEIPRLTDADFEKLAAFSYPERAAYILSLFLSDFSYETLLEMTGKAYGNRWDDSAPAPVQKLDENTFLLELWHGPTCAFKDVALQMLPRLTSASLEVTGESRNIHILVATSGDTGKAALEGFRDVPRVGITVYYPELGVSDIQRLQMITQAGENVNVVAVQGNFDDTQTGVKNIFSDEVLREELNGRAIMLSSANSINWGRLVPQIVYYFSAYLDLCADGTIELGSKIDFAVPTGNFGNILAGYYAREMGLPIRRLVCASNCNDVLADFLATGIYDINREFYTTTSPSMDILVSSNLERLLYHVTGGDAEAIAGFMADLKRAGKFKITKKLLKLVQSMFEGGAVGDKSAADIMNRTFDETGYLFDPHTAVAAAVLENIRSTEPEDKPTVVICTASPYKFAGSVLSALYEDVTGTGFDQITRLESITGTKAPACLRELKDKEVRFTKTVKPDGMGMNI